MYPLRRDTSMRVDVLPNVDGGFHKIAALTHAVSGRVEKGAERVIPFNPRTLVAFIPDTSQRLGQLVGRVRIEEPQVIADFRVLATDTVSSRDRARLPTRMSEFTRIPPSELAPSTLDQIVKDEARKRVLGRDEFDYGRVGLFQLASQGVRIFSSSIFR